MPVMPLRGVPSTAEIIALLEQSRTGFWLDSATLGRYSLVGLDPVCLFTYRDGQNILHTSIGERRIGGAPLPLLRDLMHEISITDSVPFPFLGGAVGFLGYDLGRTIERLPTMAAQDRPIPDLMLGFYIDALLIDHETGFSAIVGVDSFPGASAASWSDVPFAERSRRWLELLEGAGRSARPSAQPLRPVEKATWSLSRERYHQVVQRALQYINAGDIYQVNLAQRLSLWPPPNPLDLYRYLRNVNPEPYAAYLQFPDVSLVGASPEEFLSKRGRDIVTRPIKGTRRRGKSSAEDAMLRKELAESEKDAAELTMIVDLERNDLGRVAEIGSVRVTQLADIEAHPFVFHRVATVAARLSEGTDAVGLLEATFPGGSITGAPKIRAMEIIDELEPVRRGPYTGSVGYISSTGDIGLNIVIRTVVIMEAGADMHVGGGIVADSQPVLEYEETLAKVAGLLKAWNLAPEDVVPLEQKSYERVVQT